MASHCSQGVSLITNVLNLLQADDCSVVSACNEKGSSWYIAYCRPCAVSLAQRLCSYTRKSALESAKAIPWQRFLGLSSLNRQQDSSRLTSSECFDQIEILDPELLGGGPQSAFLDVRGICVRTGRDVLALEVEDKTLLSLSLLFIDRWRAILAVAFVAVDGVRQGVF